MKHFYTIIYNVNRNIFKPYDVIPYLITEYKESKYDLKTFDEFKNFILRISQYQWWSRCEYEIILSDWPTQKHEEKWDIFKQVKMNIDIITEIVMNEILNK